VKSSSQSSLLWSYPSSIQAKVTGTGTSGSSFAVELLAELADASAK
jgi:hypothetical protein